MSTSVLPHNLKWDTRFMDIVNLLAGWSKDRSKGVGCVIVGPAREIRSTGYNGFPRGVDDLVDSRHERPAKYKWTEHAERNAIYNAARIGISLIGCTAYVNWTPCMDCARALAQSGIERIVVEQRPDFGNPTFGEDFKTVPHLLAEALVRLEYL